MSQSDTTAVLNDLLALHVRSFPMYLRDTGWSGDGSKNLIVETFHQVATDQAYIAQRVAKAIREMEGKLDDGEYPMEFTELHDLSTDYLLLRAIEYQQETIDGVQMCVQQLRLTLAVSPLAEEALGMAKGHLESLQEVVGQTA